MNGHRCAAADDAAIRSLIGLTARLGDEGEPEEYHRVYTSDAVWRMGATRQTGAAEIVAAAAARRAEGISGPGTATRHFVVPLQIEVTGDRAYAVSYFQFLTGTTGTPSLKLAGSYRDELVRTGDGWRIQHRETVLG
jgi:ketosteroid isomerase-like protein